jgi:hypothetical protein
MEVTSYAANRSMFRPESPRTARNAEQAENLRFIHANPTAWTWQENQAFRAVARVLAGGNEARIVVRANY